MCAVLEVSPTGYYDFLKRAPSATELRNQALSQEIRKIHTQTKQRYGSPRIHEELVDAGQACCVNTVAKLMREAGIRAYSSRRFRPRTTDSDHNKPVAENHLDRQFEVPGPNQVWLADITYLDCIEGWLYLAAVCDLYSRRIVGWSMDTKMESRLVVDALEMAISSRLPGEGFLAHSDRGSQYASAHYQRLLSKNGIQCSMSRRGNCWDNAPMESFFATLKKELVRGETYETIEQAKASLFEYIEVFYNRQRRHSSLGYRSPEQFEADECS